MSKKQAKQPQKKIDTTTEEKIKEAARVVFTRKGFAAARTRDIAEEAGINLALLNYYFRSKEKLFDIIMSENIGHFVQGIKQILGDEETSLFEKNQHLVSYYTGMLVQHPDLPLFILSEIRANPDKLVQRMGVKEYLFTSPYFKQLKEAIKKSGKAINPVHFFINTISLIVFPFICGPVLQRVAEVKQDEYMALIKEREKLVPLWLDAMLKAK